MFACMRSFRRASQCRPAADLLFERNGTHAQLVRCVAVDGGAAPVFHQSSYEVGISQSARRSTTLVIATLAIRRRFVLCWPRSVQLSASCRFQRSRRFVIPYSGSIILKYPVIALYSLIC